MFRYILICSLFSVIHISNKSFSVLETGENTICLTLQDKKLFLETFCKLLLRNIIPITRAAFVFQYYIKVKSDY